MTKLLDWRGFLPAVAVLGGGALAASHVLGLPFLPTLVMLAAALFANGLVAVLEDDLPGGFNNPDGTATPAYASRIATGARWLLAVLLLAFAVAFCVSGLSPTNETPVPFVAGISLACALLSVALISQRRWVLWAALLSGLGGIGLSLLMR